MSTPTTASSETIIQIASGFRSVNCMVRAIARAETNTASQVFQLRVVISSKASAVIA